ncbi:hypothetical protein [Streptomyces cadmiisoli]|uniref:hypothetical protein n=1 Tax=Streptomyces cadmiisoli TaxID=2184053 RepID=UPI0013A70B9A|nr:hypothetical protein [Streptomyces cadmiisoli]
MDLVLNRRRLGYRLGAVASHMGVGLLQYQKVEEFINCYTRLLTQVWGSEECSRRLDEHPRTLLSEVGLNISADATLHVLREEIAGFHLGHQIDLWNQGLQTGQFTLYVPRPLCADGDLSEVDLGDLAGGVKINCQIL